MQNIINKKLVILVIIASILYYFSTPYIERENFKKAIQRTSEMYGENNPTNLQLNQEIAEDSFEPMYIASVDGKFTRGDIKATRLVFSVLADGSMVSAILGLNGDQQAWEEKKSFKNNFFRLYGINH